MYCISDDVDPVAISNGAHDSDGNFGGHSPLEFRSSARGQAASPV